MYEGERFNAISHVIGGALSLIGLTVLVIVSAWQQNGMKLAAFAVYGGTLTLLYVSSTLYHSLRGRAKSVFRVIDHCTIYLLIAGTYTPFTLITLRGAWGWWLFGAIWTLAAIGIVKDVVFHARWRAVSVVLYIVMGWLVVVAMRPLAQALPLAGVAWLFAGGVFYTVGVVFYAMSRKVRHAHGIWHLFVLGGSLCHFIALFVYVAL
jgi:hemolysin III